jgi:uncharacterized protein (TIGR02217 family)
VSDLIFPTFRGLQYPIGKTPHWNTIVQESISGVKKFLQCYTYPYYTFNLSFSYLSDMNLQQDDIHKLMGFYNQLGGAGQDFLFADPLFEDNRCVKQLFGTGDGEKKSFRLVHKYGTFVEPIFGMKDKPHIYVNDVETTAFTWDKTGLITFTNAPAENATLKWTGRWFYRCHFQNDEAEFQQIFYGGWDLEEIVLESIKLE